MAPFIYNAVHISGRCLVRDRPRPGTSVLDENMAARREYYDTADVLLDGRETYDSVAGAWPRREAAGGERRTVRQATRDVRKIVFSRPRPDSPCATLS